MRRSRIAIVAALALLPVLCQAQQKPADAVDKKPSTKPAGEAQRGRFGYPPNMPDAAVETYKKVGDVELKVWLFKPKAPAAATPRPAIVFFFGGGWKSGSPAQFERQCRHLAERGMVAITADYRVASRHNVKPAQCVADAKSCIRWVRANAARLGVDPERIVAAGGSAGGHLAACTGTVPGQDDPADDAKVSARPAAMVLFNPCVVTAPKEGVDLKGFASNTTADQLGCPREAISPLHHVAKGVPPTLILHGRADTTVPYATVEAFESAMKQAGNVCKLVGYEGQPHGFFNGAGFDATLNEMDQFLVGLGYLPAAK
jgi:acetyl esterase/lipase